MSAERYSGINLSSAQHENEKEETDLIQIAFSMAFLKTILKATFQLEMF